MPRAFLATCHCFGDIQSKQILGFTRSLFCWVRQEAEDRDRAGQEVMESEGSEGPVVGRGRRVAGEGALFEVGTPEAEQCVTVS